MSGNRSPLRPGPAELLLLSGEGTHSPGAVRRVLKRGEEFLKRRLLVFSPRPVRSPVRLLFEELTTHAGRSVLDLGSPLAAVAAASSLVDPEAKVTYWTNEAFEVRRVASVLELNEVENRVRVELAPSPCGEARFDSVWLGAPAAADKRYTASLVRDAWRCLAHAGKLIAASDRRRDRWLRDTIAKTFGSVSEVGGGRSGVVYVARKRRDRPPRRREAARSFDCAPFGQSLRMETMPGVFSHGRLDDGALALAEVAAGAVDTAERIVDLGCGSGALGIGALRRQPRSRAILVDSNARAAGASLRNARENDVADRAVVLLAADLESVREQSVDLVLANPPYFGEFRITEHFAGEAAHALRPGGRLYLVTKAPEPTYEVLQEVLGDASIDATARRGYTVFEATMGE